MGLFSGGKRILVAGGEGVALYSSDKRGVFRETALAWDVPNFEQQLTAILLGKNQNQTLCVLFDGADQTYRKEENIPKLSAVDRPRFVQRKLELAFPSHPVRAAAEIKHIKIKGIPPPDKKEAPSYLFAALAETDNIDRVGKSVYDSGVPVTGFGLLPAESASLVTALAGKIFNEPGKRSRWAVLIGQHETGGLRQVVIKDGNLALTRLTPTSDKGTSGAGWVEEVIQEFKATLTYISRFGYKTEEGLDVIVICGDLEKQFFDQKALPVTHLKCLTLTEALGVIGSRSMILEKGNFADALHAVWAGRKTILDLPVKVPSIQKVIAPRLIARYGSGILAATAIAAVFFIAQTYQDYHQIQNDITEKQNQRNVRQREYEEEAKAFDTLPAKPKEVKAVINIKKTLETNTTDLRPVLHKLKEAMGGDVFLRSLDISHESGKSLNPNISVANKKITPEEEEKGVLKITFSFTLPSTMQLEEKVIRSEKLRNDLKGLFPGYDVIFKSQFGNVSRTGKFSGGTAAEDKAGPGTESAEIEMEGAPL